MRHLENSRRPRGITLVVYSLAVVLGAAQTVKPDARHVLPIQDAIVSGDLEQAERLLRAALKEGSKDAGLVNLRGVLHAKRGELAAASEDFSLAVKLDPSLVPAWQNLGRACQAESEQKPTAVACSQKAWEHVLVRQTADAEAVRGLALSLQRQGKYDESLQRLAHAENGTAELMIQCLDLAGLKRKKEAIAMATRLGQGQDFGEGDLEAMGAAGPEVTVILAEAIDKRGELKESGLSRLAVAYEQTDRLSDARKELERAAAAEPNDERHLLELAHVAERQNDREGALGYLGHARELAPNDAQVHFLFGMVAAEMELPMEAKRSFERALELSPENPDYNFAMGSVILTTRDASTAAGYFEKFLAVRPESARGHYALGLAEFSAGDYVRAKAQMQRVEEDREVGGGAAFFLGRMARLEDQPDSAKKYLAKAIRLMPKFSESHTEMGRLLMREGKMSEAENELKRALELDSNSFQAHAQLSALYSKLHDPRAAVESETLKKLDEERSKRAEMMLRGVEIRP